MLRWLPLLFLMSALTAAAAPSPDTVVLLHGVGMGPWTMRPLATTLRQAGYHVVNVGYPSRTLTLEQLASDYLPAQLQAAGCGSAARLHFVTHSMGSIVLRLYLRDHCPANLGRVVMLGPPNHGSTAADHAADSAPLRWLLGRNLRRLGTGPDAITRELGPADFELGVIAGNASINPLAARWLDGPNDGAVTVASARLEGMRDFLVVPWAHTPMLWRRQVGAQVLAFLRTGRFAPAAG